MQKLGERGRFSTGTARQFCIFHELVSLNFLENAAVFGYSHYEKFLREKKICHLIRKKIKF